MVLLALASVQASASLAQSNLDNAPWSLQVADAGGDVGYRPSLALDRFGTPHISYYDGTNADLKYATLAGDRWIAETVDTLKYSGSWSSIAIDSLGRPSIAYQDGTNSALKFAIKENGTWIKEVAVASGVASDEVSLALDGADTPHISFNEHSYATRINGSWRTEVITPAIQGWCDSLNELYGNVCVPSPGTSLSLDLQGRPAVAFVFTWGAGTDNERLIHLTRAVELALRETDGWHVSVVAQQLDTPFCNPSLAYGPDGVGRIAVMDGGVEYINGTTREFVGPAAFACYTDPGIYPSLTVNRAGNPFIAYVRADTGNVTFAQKVNGSWTPEVVEAATGDVLHAGVSLRVGGGQLEVAYRNVPLGDLKFGARTAPPGVPVAHAGGPYSQVYAPTNILNGTGSYDPNGGSLNYSWDLNGDGLGDAYGAVPRVAFPRPGIFFVALTVTNVAGLSSRDIAMVNLIISSGVSASFGLQNFPYPFVDKGVINATIVIGASNLHLPLAPASTIDSVAGAALGARLGRMSRPSPLPADIDIEDAHSPDGQHVVVTRQGNLIALGGRGVNYISYRYNASLPVRFEVGIYVTSSGFTYRRLGLYGTGGPVVDYALVSLFNDTSAGRTILVAAGLSGFATRAVATLLATDGLNFSGTGIVVALLDLQGDGTYEGWSVVDGVNATTSYLAPFPAARAGQYLVIPYNLPHAPVGGAHTIEVAGAISLAASRARNMTSSLVPIMDIEAGHVVNSTGLTITAPGDLIVIGGRGANWVTHVYNTSLAVRTDPGSGVVVEVTGNHYRLQGNYFQGAPVTDYGLWTVYTDVGSGRTVEVLQGLSGFSTRAVTAIVASGAIPYRGAGTVLRLSDLDGDASYESWNVAEVANRSVLNGGFERDGNGDRLPDYWQVMPGSIGQAQSSQLVVHSGASSLSLTPGTSGAVQAFSEAVACVPGVTYRASAWAYLSAPGALRATLRFWSGNHYLSTQIGLASAAEDAVGRWVPMEFSAVAPSACTQADVTLGTSQRYPAAGYFDDVGLTLALPGTGLNSVSNGGFELSPDPDLSIFASDYPVFWVTSSNTIRRTQALTHSGSWAIVIDATGVADTNMGLVTESIPCNPGAAYALLAWNYLDEGKRVTLTLSFWYQGVPQATSGVSNTRKNAWVQMALAATAPGRCDAIYVQLTNPSFSPGLDYMDDVALVPMA